MISLTSSSLVWSSGWAWGAGLGRELNRFLSNQGREMDVVFGGVFNVTTIVGSDSVWSERVVVDNTLDVVVGFTLVCEHLEECCASRSQATQQNWGGGEYA